MELREIGQSEVMHAGDTAPAGRPEEREERGVTPAGVK